MDDAPDPHAVVRAFELPGRLVDCTDVVGGWSNRVLRLATSRGVYAVKQLRNAWGEPRWREWLAEGWRLEQAARAAGLVVPSPVPVPATGECVALVDRRDGAGVVPVRLHEWVDGDPVPPEPVPTGIARELGRVLATLHGLALAPLQPELYEGEVRRTTADVWPRLVQRARTARAPWADALAASEPFARRATALLDRGAAPRVLSHGDLDQKNLLVSGRTLVVLDWDVVVPVVPAHDLAGAALAMASWREPHVARAVVDGYAQVTGQRVGLTPTDLGASLAARLGWIRFTVDRFVDSAGSSGASHHDPDVPSLLDELARRVEVAENLDAWLRADGGQ